jgi:hypothetical protein
VVIAVGHDHRLLADDEAEHVELVVPSERAVGHREQFSNGWRIADDRHAGWPSTETADRPVPLAQLVEDHVRGREDSTEMARLVTPRRAGEWLGLVHVGHTMSASAA